MAVFQDKNKNGKIVKTKDGRSWYFKVYKKDFQGINKAYKSKKFISKKEAEEAERLFLMKRNNPIHKPFTLVAYDYFENLYITSKESTAYSHENYYNNHIKNFFSKLCIDDINISILKEWQNYMIKKKLKIRTLNKAYTVLKNIFSYATKNYNLPVNYVSLLGPFNQKNDKVIADEEKIRYITYEQFQTFVSVIDSILWKTFFTFLYYTGMRKGEIQALTWNDINFSENEIIVNKTLSVKVKNRNEQNYKITSTKNNQNRKIKINETLKHQLLLYYNSMCEYIDFSKNWFVFGGPKFMPQTTIDRKKEKYFKLAKLNSITIHEFRHSHVSLLINEYIKTSKEKNMEVDTAKFFLMMSNRMGHTIDVMQKTYMHLFPTIQDEIIDLLNNL